MYTCLSYDVVVHETTHAVLDGLRRRFLEPGLPDQAAFHEGFADIVALLSVFSMHPVVEQALGRPTRTGGSSDGESSRDARAGACCSGRRGDRRGAHAGPRRAPRSALKPPPPDWRELPEFQEPHRRGEVLVAVVFDCSSTIWVERLQPLLPPEAEAANVATLDRARAAEEGAGRHAQLLTMMIRGLDYLPPVEFEFGDLLNAVLLADAEVVAR